MRMNRFSFSEENGAQLFLTFIIFRQAYSLSLLKQQGRTSLGLADLILNKAESF